MFDTLTDKLNGVFQRLTGRGRLTEKDVDEALREVRRALLEADVDFRVARDFVARVRERALGGDVLESLSPGQQVVKIVNDEMTAILTAGDHKLGVSSQAPTVVMMAGLQGSGKTTTAAKLALHLRRQGHHPLLVAADLRRPAAIEQLAVLGKQLDVPVYREDGSTAVKTATNGVAHARQLGLSFVIVDTGGRLEIDDEMMEELRQVYAAVSPHETLLVVDSMTGQVAVTTAQGFNEYVGITGLILTKMDGDARGGAALSISQVTGIPIKFMGTGERNDALEPFFPDRTASRILGMGDVLTLVERAQEVVDEKKAREMERKIRRATFDLEDFLEQLQGVKQMGSLSSIVEMIPGFSQISKRLPSDALDSGGLVKAEAIIRSMTPQERRDPSILNGSRRRRIARGSGTTPQDVNQILNQFRQAQKMMKQFSQGRGPRNLMGMFR
jgi:signal recognition particle subunit SRP54